eukprot:sb/3475771/
MLTITTILIIQLVRTSLLPTSPSLQLTLFTDPNIPLSLQLTEPNPSPQVEVKPYVLDDQLCDECNGEHCGGKFAPFFCGHISCLRYFCEHCWSVAHTQPGREYHKPLVKEGADRSRSLNSFRW